MGGGLSHPIRQVIGVEIITDLEPSFLTSVAWYVCSLRSIENWRHHLLLCIAIGVLVSFSCGGTITQLVWLPVISLIWINLLT